MFNYIVGTYNGENLTIVFIFTPRLFFNTEFIIVAQKERLV